MGSKAPSAMEEGTCQHTGLGKLLGEMGLAFRPGNGKDLGYWGRNTGAKCWENQPEQSRRNKSSVFKGQEEQSS